MGALEIDEQRLVVDKGRLDRYNELDFFEDRELYRELGIGHSL